MRLCGQIPFNQRWNLKGGIQEMGKGWHKVKTLTFMNFSEGTVYSNGIINLLYLKSGQRA